MRELNVAFDALIAADATPRGSFTRAYIHAALTIDQNTTRIWLALIRAQSTETQVAEQWHVWLAQRLQHHADTDTGEIFTIVRLAADGACFTSLNTVASAEVLDLPAIRARLLGMTF